MEKFIRMDEPRARIPHPEERSLRQKSRSSQACADCVNLSALGAPKGDALSEMPLSQAASGKRNKTSCAFRRAMPLAFEGQNQQLNLRTSLARTG